MRRLVPPIEAGLTSRSAHKLTLWSSALRAHQWSKNLLVFVALVLNHGLERPESVAATVAGFFIMSAIASATYIVNDLVDLDADRAHATKRYRPFASGKLSARAGLMVAGVLLVGGFGSAMALSARFAVVLAIYTGISLAYSFRLKRVPMVDVSILAALYCLRIEAGAVLAGAPLTVWLMTFAGFLFYSLAMAKRHSELVKSNGIASRGYRAQDATVTLPMGIAAAVAAILVMMLFLVFEASENGEYRRPEFLWPAPILIALWVQRIWLLAARGDLEDDPVAFAVRDRVSLGLGAVLGACVLASL